MIWLVVIGVAGGLLGGLLGVGGGVLFVPGLVLVIGLSQHEAEATSLLAIVPVALVGALNQDRYGNVRRRDAMLIGLFSLAGVAAGVAFANALSGEALRDAFAGLLIVIALQLVHRTLNARTAASMPPDHRRRADGTVHSTPHSADDTTHGASTSPTAGTPHSNCG